jgi:hypothetical protein
VQVQDSPVTCISFTCVRECILNQLTPILRYNELMTSGKMSKIFSVLGRAQVNCEQYGSWLKENYPKIENFFAMLWKHIVSTREILKMYHQDTIPIEMLLYRKDYYERFMLVLRAAWIFQLSVVEYSMKKSLQQFNGPVATWYKGLKDNPHVKGEKLKGTLRNIVRISAKEGIVMEFHLTSWLNLQDLRNAIIHNNGIIGEDKTFTIGDVKKHIEAGENVRYSHLDAAHFLALIPFMSKKWLEGFLKTHTLS